MRSLRVLFVNSVVGFQGRKCIQRTVTDAGRHRDPREMRRANPIRKPYPTSCGELVSVLWIESFRATKEPDFAGRIGWAVTVVTAARTGGTGGKDSKESGPSPLSRLQFACLHPPVTPVLLVGFFSEFDENKATARTQANRRGLSEFDENKATARTQANGWRG